MARYRSEQAGPLLFGQDVLAAPRLAQPGSRFAPRWHRRPGPVPASPCYQCAKRRHHLCTDRQQGFIPRLHPDTHIVSHTGSALTHAPLWRAAGEPCAFRCACSDPSSPRPPTPSPTTPPETPCPTPRPPSPRSTPRERRGFSLTSSRSTSTRAESYDQLTAICRCAYSVCGYGADGHHAKCRTVPGCRWRPRTRTSSTAAAAPSRWCGGSAGPARARPASPPDHHPRSPVRHRRQPTARPGRAGDPGSVPGWSWACRTSARSVDLGARRPGIERHGIAGGGDGGPGLR